MKELNPILKYIFVLWVTITPALGLKAQQKSTDTILNMVLSEPFFYNVVGSFDGKIFAGTSKGIIQIDGKDLISINKESGYITLTNKGNPIISETGISNYRERKYLHLLPYPDQSRDEFHASAQNYFYMCSGGRLYIFDLSPYLYSYANHSIRTISNQFIGTYSGIYRKGVLLNPRTNPNYVDGNIREINGKAFVCYDYLVTLGLNDTSNQLRPLQISEKEEGGIRDIAYSKSDNVYFIFSNQFVYSADTSFSSVQPIYEAKNTKKNINYIGQKGNQHLFTDDTLLFTIWPQQKIDTLALFEEPILAGTVTGLHAYLLSANNVYAYNHNRTVDKINLRIKKAHSIVALSENELVVSSDEGLYLLNTVTKELGPLVNGVEFNRRALYVENGKIIAGSINGLYTLDASRLKDISADIVQRQKDKTAIPSYVYKFIGTGIVIILFLLYLLLNARHQLQKKISQINELSPTSIDRAKIEEYVRNNLTNASLKSVAEHFNTNNSFIYRLLAPDKPGTIISQIRKVMVENMKREGHSATEISLKTGLSKSYISKI